MAEFKENNIEWLTGEDRVTVTLSSRRHISKIKKLATEFPDHIKIISENDDRSICAHLPIKCIKFGKPVSNRTMSEEHKQKIRDNWHKMLEARKASKSI